MLCRRGSEFCADRQSESPDTFHLKSNDVPLNVCPRQECQPEFPDEGDESNGDGGGSVPTYLPSGQTPGTSHPGPNIPFKECLPSIMDMHDELAHRPFPPAPVPQMVGGWRAAPTGEFHQALSA